MVTYTGFNGAADFHPRKQHAFEVFSCQRLALPLASAGRPAHLDSYLDEFPFRFNRRRSRHRGMLFYRLAQQAVQVNPVPYMAMVKDVGRGPRRHHKM